MNAGRELDEKIAREVMGWTKATLHDEVSGPEQYWCSGKVAHVLVDSWKPSTFIHYAWQVAEKLSSPVPYKGHDFTLCGNGRTWEASFANDDAKVFSADADTAPLAICLAALQAVSSTK